MPIVLISGGTGLVGTKLTRYLLERNYEIIILSRPGHEHPKEHSGITYSEWDVEKEIIDAGLVRKADHIIHLAGAGVMDKKWTASYKKQILRSRTRSAALIINCLRGQQHNVKTFVSASAIGYYGGDRGSLPRIEGFIETDLPGNDFLAETCVLWEAASDPVTALGIRLVKLRTGIVLSNDGGAFKEFREPLRWGMATVLGNGRQVMSWVHIEDLCRMYHEAISNVYMNGVYNAVSPQPVPQKELIITAAEIFRNKFYSTINVPVFMLKLLKGDRSMEILKSATVSEKKIRSTGFTFLYPTLHAALTALKDNK